MNTHKNPPGDFTQSIPAPDPTAPTISGGPESPNK